MGGGLVLTGMMVGITQDIMLLGHHKLLHHEGRGQDLDDQDLQLSGSEDLVEEALGCQESNSSHHLWGMVGC